MVEVKHPKYTDNSSLAGAYYESFQDFLSSRHLECGSITFFFFFFFLRPGLVFKKRVLLLFIGYCSEDFKK